MYRVHSSVFRPKNTTTTCQLLHLFRLPRHWRGATAQCTLHSASPVGKSPKAQVTEEIPTPTETSAKRLCSAIVSSPRSKIFSVLSSPSSVCVPEQPQKAIVNVSPLFQDRLLVHQRPIWNVGYPPHTALVLHKHCSWSQLALDYFSETNRLRFTLNFRRTKLRLGLHCSHFQLFEEVVWSGKTVHSRSFPPTSQHQCNSGAKN